jgi:uncharacterized protein YdhG (YjbR/CyaY superfamily)
VDPAVQAYIDAIDPAHRPLFDRVHAIIGGAAPAAELVLSYGMPTYRAGPRRLYVGVWKHGLSLYGWGEGGDAGFVDRHPELKHAKGTIRLTPDAAAAVDDAELEALARAVLTD